MKRFQKSKRFQKVKVLPVLNIRQADVLDQKEVRFAINKSPSDGFTLEVCVVRAQPPHRPQPCHADRHFRRWEISVSCHRWMLFWTMLRWRDRFDGLQMQMWLGTMVCRCGFGYWQSELMYISPRITGLTQKSMHSHMRVCAGSQLQMWLGTMERVIGRSGHFRHWSPPQCHPNAKHQ